MEELFTRMWHDLTSRIHGPMAIRFYLQPAMAIVFAIKDGIKDTKKSSPPYLWAIFTHPEQRRDLIQDGWKSIGKIFILAILLDMIYQLLVLKRFFPGEALIVAVTLAVLPYSLLRGPTSRILLFLKRKA